MAKIAQFRYYSSNSKNAGQNFPTDYTYQNFCVNESFAGYNPIRQFGIQTIPGTKIYLNASQNPIVIGSTGIFEIDCQNTTANITTFRVAEDSMKTIDNLENGYLIIDIVYGEEKEV